LYTPNSTSLSFPSPLQHIPKVTAWAERELLKKLNEEGTFFRVTGSGQTGYGDLVGLYDNRFLVIEVKSTRKDRYYLSKDKEQLTELMEECRGSEAEPYLAVRFKREPEWVIVNFQDFDKKKVTRNTRGDLEV